MVEKKVVPMAVYSVGWKVVYWAAQWVVELAASRESMWAAQKDLLMVGYWASMRVEWRVVRSELQKADLSVDLTAVKKARLSAVH